MAFKSMTEYNEERYGDMFMLRNDGDSADVIFMYPSRNDVMMVESHYIKSDKYSGYTQCLGQRICPACEQGIRIQNKLFIPLYVIDSDQILFWDRNTRFFQQLDNDVFSKFANPTEFVFRITRRGTAGDINTRYEIQAVAKNNVDEMSYDAILAKLNVTFPDYYNTICADWSEEEYKEHLGGCNAQVDVDSMPEYKISPRGVSAVVDVPDLSSLTSSSETGLADAEEVDF